MMSLTSSPSMGTENFTNDPQTTLHDEKMPEAGRSPERSPGRRRPPSPRGDR